MKRILLIPKSFFPIFLLLSISAFSQNDFKRNYIMSLTAGRIAFGTGDFFGYSVNLGYEWKSKGNKNIFKHISYGTELTFENGSKQPKVINPTFQEFISKTYYSTTNIIITPKISYYPFNTTFARGINITVGASVGYTNQNKEFQSTYIFDPVSQTSVRRSYLEYLNKVVVGYRIAAGYDFHISKQILIGGRLDLSNYSGDINTVIAGKVGYSF